MDWLVDATEVEISERDWPVWVVAESIERFVEEARALTSCDKAFNDLPQHWAPLLQTSPVTVRLPFSSMERVVEPFWFLSNRPCGVPSSGASVKLKLLAKNRSPL